MIRPHEPLAARYLDYGKIFVPNGALDFSTLAYSDAEVARYGAQLFNRGLMFPDNSPFATLIGSVSAALLMFEGGYLFTLVQRRREGELSADPRTDRPFNQVRFVLLAREAIEQAFAARAALYTSLAQAARDPDGRVWLTDYTAPGEERAWSPTLKRIDPAAPDPAAVRFVSDAVVAAARAAAQPGSGAGPQSIAVPLPAGDLLERLQLVEAVQYWVLPRLGVLSFALDYVTIQNVHMRLFQLPADAPAPLPPERIFAPGQATAHLADDYHAALSGLEHEALYDEALPGLLRLPLTTAEAVYLFRIEKQAQPLTGAEALRLYPALAGLGERRFNLLRRVPRDDLMGLLRRPELSSALRLDLLQVAFEAAHGLLPVYAAAHLAVPRAAREDAGSRERIQDLLRASVAKSLAASLAVVAEEHQAELFRDLLLARRAPPASGRGQPEAVAPLTLATGQPLLEALILSRRTPALASALQDVVPHDPALFREALDILDRAVDLQGLLWLWQNAGRRDLRYYAALLERPVQPAWYAELSRDSGTWRALLEEGRALALAAAGEAEPGAALLPGALLSALPRPLVPFVWQASLATAERDAGFAEWWLFNEALALPDQLPNLWQALQRLPAPALREASPRMNYLLGQSAAGMSLLEACTLPGHAEANEALYATVLRAWLSTGFRSAAGDLVLGTSDVEFLIENLPGSNDILAAVAASPAQAPALLALPPEQALRWAQVARGERRQPYRTSGRDGLFQRLIALQAPDEALLWHLLVDDEGTAPDTMPWADYLALVDGGQVWPSALALPPESRLRAYLDATSRLENRAVGDVFHQNGIDIRRVLALLAIHSADPADAADLLDSLLLLAVFHLQESGAELKERAAALLRAALRQPDITAHLQGLPDNVLAYLRQHFCERQPDLVAAGHWIEAELLRRTNTYRVDKPAKGGAVRPSRTRQAGAARRAAIQTHAASGVEPDQPSTKATADAPASARAPAGSSSGPAPANLVGEVVLPGDAPKRRDSALWLWIVIIVIALLTCAVLAGAFVWIRSLS